jgi:hypothetical protein
MHRRTGNDAQRKPASRNIAVSQSLFSGLATREDSMRKLKVMMLVAGAVAWSSVATAQTSNSGASGYVGDQEKAGSATHPPGEPDKTSTSGDVSGATSARNSGAGISGAAGNKNGPAGRDATVGSSTQDNSVQQQDAAKVQGLPGNKSGPPAKR